jgi:signal transduction histidine kinase
MRSRPRLTVTAILFVVSLLAAWPASAQPAAWPVSAQPAGGTASAQPGGGIDRGYITPDAVLAAVAHPRRLLTAPELELLPLEIISAAGLKELGLDPVQIEEVLAIAVVKDTRRPPQFGLVLRFAEPLRQGGLLPELVRHTTRAELNGKGYRKAVGPEDFSLMRADPRTILIAHDELLGKMLANVANPQPGPAAKLLGQMSGSPDIAAVVALDPIRPMLKAQLQKAPIPPAFAGFLTIPDLVVSAEAQLSLPGHGPASVTLRARDEQSAKQLEAMINALLDMAKMGAQMQAGKMAESQDPVAQATAKYMQRTSGRMIDRLRPVREGYHLSLSEKNVSLETDLAVVAMVAFMTFSHRSSPPAPVVHVVPEKPETKPAGNDRAREPQ